MGDKILIPDTLHLYFTDKEIENLIEELTEVENNLKIFL